MKIAILSRYQNKIFRGAESFVFELSNYLSTNHDVSVLSGRDADSLKMILQGRYDIVVSINGKTQAIKASWGRLIRGYKLVIAGQSGIGRDDIFNIVAAKPDVFVALTDYMKDWAKKWSWGSLVVKIPNGVNLDIFRANGDKLNLALKKPLVLSVGALSWYKHHEKTIEAVSMLRDVSLLIVGRGEDYEKLNILGRTKLKDRFAIQEFNYSQMPNVYRSADIFVLPSWEREAFGIVYIEAMASGLPIVAPDDLPRREIIGSGGLYADVNSPIDYSKKIDQALKINWGNKPILQAQKFSWQKVGQQYEEMFQKIMN